MNKRPTHRDIPQTRDVERARCDRANARLFGELSLSSGAALPKSKYVGTAGDERTLRGIPAIGRNVSGHIPGTHPERRVVG